MQKQGRSCFASDTKAYCRVRAPGHVTDHHACCVEIATSSLLAARRSIEDLEPSFHLTRTFHVQLEQLFAHYFKKVKEKRIRENFVLIYELLDEVCDYGIPQITDPFALKNYIFQKGAFEKGVLPQNYQTAAHSLQLSLAKLTAPHAVCIQIKRRRRQMSPCR